MKQVLISLTYIVLFYMSVLPENITGSGIKDSCGISKAPITRVVGGVESPLNAWPWMAILIHKAMSTPTHPFVLCGGVLINHKYVLSAAHCAFNRSSALLPPNTFRLRLGEKDVTSDNDGANPIDIDVAKLILHENYNYDDPSQFNDIALIKLAQSVEYSKSIQPICLPTEEMKSELFTDVHPFTAGWGAREHGGQGSPVLRHVQVDVHTNEHCQNMYSRRDVTIIKTHLCAGYKLGGKDACQGDSGGPLMFPVNNIWYTIGVVSHGIGCGEPQFSGIYTRVTSYLSWIHARII